MRPSNHAEPLRLFMRCTLITAGLFGLLLASSACPGSAGDVDVSGPADDGGTGQDASIGADDGSGGDTTGAGVSDGWSGEAGGGAADAACGLDNLPPTSVVATGPTGGAVVTGTTAELTVTIDDVDSSSFSGLFYLRKVHPLTAADDFTIVILPDTQNYTQNGGAGNSNMSHYNAQTAWVATNRDKAKIAALLHNGDVVQHGNVPAYEYEWKRADSAMQTIEGKWPQYPDGIPYGVAVGNHDNGAISHGDKPYSTAMFNKYFGVKRFAGRQYYGGHYGSKNDNSWLKVRAGNLDVVMVNFEYRGEAGQPPAVLSWGRSVFNKFPDALGIVNSHHIVTGAGTFCAEGKAIYNAMKVQPNVQLMTCGHIKDSRKRRTDTYQGHVIHSMLADYQHDSATGCFGGCGYMRLWHFSPAKNELFVRTYSPSLKKYKVSGAEQFKLKVDLSAATGLFAAAGSATTQTKTLTYTVTGLSAGRTYQWYAEVEDCGAKKKTKTATFVTP